MGLLRRDTRERRESLNTILCYIIYIIYVANFILKLHIYFQGPHARFTPVLLPFEEIFNLYLIYNENKKPKFNREDKI